MDAWVGGAVLAVVAVLALEANNRLNLPGMLGMAAEVAVGFVGIFAGLGAGYLLTRTWVGDATRGTVRLTGDAAPAVATIAGLLIVGLAVLALIPATWSPKVSASVAIVAAVIVLPSLVPLMPRQYGATGIVTGALDLADPVVSTISGWFL